MEKSCREFAVISFPVFMIWLIYDFRHCASDNCVIRYNDNLVEDGKMCDIAFENMID
jgi:hypothetical protein